jgi:hypothetical protein
MTPMDNTGRARHRRHLSVLGAIVLTVGTGCSAVQTIALADDGSGTASTSITIDPVFAAYLTDLYAGMGATNAESLFDLEAIRTSLSAQPGISVGEIRSPAPAELEIDFAFASVDALLRLQGQRVAPFLRFERTEAFRRVAGAVDRESIEHFVTIAGIDPFLTESLLPPERDMSEEEYRDHLAWAFEEYAEDRPLDIVFRDSRVVTIVTPAGPIIQVRGGEISNGGARYVTPLIEAVTATRPLEYSLVYAAAAR